MLPRREVRGHATAEGGPGACYRGGRSGGMLPRKMFGNLHAANRYFSAF